MRTSFIPTEAISHATRESLARIQVRMTEAQTEVTTGRHADVGLSLGLTTGRAVSLRHEHARLGAIIEANSVVSTRLEATQSALGKIAADAQSFIGNLLGARNSADGPKLIEQQARGMLDGLVDTLNTTTAGEYLFAGINADVKPLANYSGNPASVASQSISASFTASFGTVRSDQANVGITAANMQTFLDGPFSAQFSASAWSSNWSTASDRNMRSRISTSELVETSVNANDAGVRQLAEAFTMVADLGTQNLNASAFQALIDTAAKRAGEAVQKLGNTQSALGVTQERVTRSSDHMSLQIDIMNKHISALESVDPYEASTRLSSLTTELETAYAVTARIQKLSILNYL